MTDMEAKAREYVNKLTIDQLRFLGTDEHYSAGYREGMEEVAKVEVEAPMGVSGPFKDGWYASKRQHAAAIREKIKA